MKKLLGILVLGLLWCNVGFANCIGNCISGYGTYTWPSGNKFVGEHKNGKRHGQGTYTYADGEYYVGEHKDGNRQGQGTYTWANGDKFVGEFKDGVQHGQGTYIYASGDKYVGEFIDGKEHGQGTYTWANREKKFVKVDKKLQKKIKKIQENQKPNIEDTKVKQVSEVEKKEIFDPRNIATLIDKSIEEMRETTKKTDKITQSQDMNMEFSGLNLSEEDALKAQIFGCWSIPLGLPYDENLLVRIKLKLKPDGSVIKTEILDHARMNNPGQAFYKVLAESALRAIQLCQPLRVPSTGYERWKDLQLNFDAREML